MEVASLVRKNSLVGSMSLIFVFTGLMTISAYIRIPLFFTPVPLTLQTLVLYFSIIILRKKAFAPQMIYLALGFGGLAVFTNGGSGFLYLLGPTGGYLFGFLFVAGVFPYLYPAKNSFSGSLAFFTLASLVIYIFGLSHLVFFNHLSLSAALLSGLYPFIPGAIIKIILVSSFAARYR